MINNKLNLSLFIILFLAMSSMPLFSQTADEIETLLISKSITYAQAARFSLEASNVIAIRDPQEAFNYAQEQKMLPKKTASGDSARLANVSLLLMRAFNIKGGIFYSITKNSHYAYRELVHLNIIQGRADPSMTVSGEQLLFLIGKLLAKQESEVMAFNSRDKS